MLSGGGLCLPRRVHLQRFSGNQARALEAVPTSNLIREHIKPVRDQFERVTRAHSIVVEAAGRVLADSGQ